MAILIKLDYTYRPRASFLLMNIPAVNELIKESTTAIHKTIL